MVAIIYNFSDRLSVQSNRDGRQCEHAVQHDRWTMFLQIRGIWKKV